MGVPLVAAPIEAASIEPPERCTMRLVQSAESSARSPSSQTAPGQCTAESASRIRSLPEHLEDTKAFYGRVDDKQGPLRPCGVQFYKFYYQLIKIIINFGKIKYFKKSACPFRQV
jgi:hypothetical protein